ncbi:MAG: long-chain fatty acid--CoA ligase [Solirubrobacteraceae bacterium]
MLEGLMQHDHPLTVRHILDRMRRLYADSEVVTLREDGTTRASYGEVAARTDRLAGALRALGVQPEDRVATFMWNSQEHLEVYLAAPSMGAVLHTLNIRLSGEQLTYIANHAQDKVVFVDDSLVELLEPLAPTFETVEHFVVVGGGDAGSLPNALRYEDLLAAAPETFDYPEIDDRSAAALCYTSGTTGNPKGVLYSHRSTLMHAGAVLYADNLGLRSTDRVLPVVPMFHANAWGLAHAAPLTGADLVMPGRFLQGEPLAKLMESERVTVAGGVPTIWLDVLNYADAHAPDLSSLRTVACGGSAVPLSLMQAFSERHGVHITQAWGMTETSPVASVAHPPKGASEDEAWAARAKAGRPLPFLDVRIVGDDGEEVAWDGESTGELEIRGPWIARAYYNDPEGDDKFHDGWLRTGDVAAIDGQGYVKITDRSKDVIKSGGEWVSSVDLEIALMAHDDVAEAAVIAKPDERWQERPLACVVRKDGSSVSAEELCEFLGDRVAKWWIPDEFAFIGEVPKTSVGKFDKKVLRQQLADDALEGRVSVERATAR